MKGVDFLRYQRLVTRIVEMSGITPGDPQAFSFRIAGGAKARSKTGWVRVPRDLVRGLLQGELTRALESELRNIALRLMSAGQAVSRLINESEDTIFHLLETHRGRGRKPRGASRKAAPRDARSLRERVGMSILRSEPSASAKPLLGSAETQSLRTSRFIALAHVCTGRILGYIDLAWDAGQRARARRQLGYMRYRHGLSLDEEERSLRRAIFAIEGRIREIENLLQYGCGPSEISAMLDLQRELEGALFWRSAFRAQADEARRLREQIECEGLRLVS